MQKQEDQSTRKNHSGVTTEPVSTGIFKHQEIQVRNKVYVCILFKKVV
jgi:hypothetical protein